MSDIRDKERDRVLMAFSNAFKKPTTEQIVEWIERYPQYADDVRAHAAVLRDWAAGAECTDEEVSPSALNAAYSNALNAIYSAQKKEPSMEERSEAAVSFHDIAVARNIDVIQMARNMDIPRGVLADLFDGAMLRPIRKWLSAAVCRALKITDESFNAALDVVLENPHFGHAKASGAPTIRRRTCDEIIRESRMSAERKREILEGD
jgi:hypothetical protein